MALSALREGREAEFAGERLGRSDTHPDLRDCAEIKIPVVAEFNRRGRPMGPSHRVTYLEFEGPTESPLPVRQVVGDHLIRPSSRLRRRGRSQMRSPFGRIGCGRQLVRRPSRRRIALNKIPGTTHCRGIAPPTAGASRSSGGWPPPNSASI
jgi:hypothetical protein